MNILLSGYYGYDNFGDELILETLVQRLSHQRHSLTVLSDDPLRTIRTHGVRAISRWNPWTVWRAIQTSRLLISGGGGLLQTSTSRISLMYYLEVIKMAQRAGIPTVIWNQGIGPFHHPSDIRRVMATLSKTESLSVRDTASRTWLLEQGLSPGHVQLGADPAWLVQWPDYSQAEARALLKWDLLTPPLVGIALRPTPTHPGGNSEGSHALEGEGKGGGLLERIREFANHHTGTIIWMASQPKQDLPIIEMARQRLTRRNTVVTLAPPIKGCFIIKALDGLLSMRLHPLLIAARCHVPFLAVHVDPKISSLLDELDLKHCSVNGEGEIPSWPSWPKMPDNLPDKVSILQERSLSSFPSLSGTAQVNRL